MKRCGTCKIAKPLTEFNARRASKDGHCYKCRECSKAVCAEWKRQNPGAFKTWAAENVESRCQYWQGWYQAHKDQRSLDYAKWSGANKAKLNARNARRAATKKSATPAWADRSAIDKAQRLTEETGIRHEVDHIIPLRGKLACGLHCEANLQILTEAENLRKECRILAEETRT